MASMSIQGGCRSTHTSDHEAAASQRRAVQLPGPRRKRRKSFHQSWIPPEDSEANRRKLATKPRGEDTDDALATAQASLWRSRAARACVPADIGLFCLFCPPVRGVSYRSSTG